MAASATSKTGLTVSEMDSNILFEKFTVDEIRNIEKKTRHDIENKKEELRVMVGERYRDLIEAADTITEMKSSAKNVLDSLSKTEGYCQNLKKMNVQGLTSTESKFAVQRKKQDVTFFGIATQIKLLLDMAEKIWTAVDCEDYLLATQLYLLARHIHTSLQLDTKQSNKIQNWFPVVARQWAAISHFKSGILQNCRQVLRDTNRSEQVVTDCLCAIILLEDNNPRQVFNEYLLARTHAVQTLCREDIHTGGIKEQICSVVSLITSTVEQIHAIFYSGSSDENDNINLLLKTLQRVTDVNNPDSAIFQDDGSPAWKYLPKSLKDFRPSLRTVASPISPDQLREKCQHWIDTCVKSVTAGIGKLLGFVTSIKAMASIRDAVWLQLEQDEGMKQWDTICKRILSQKISVWEDFTRPLFLSRIQAILLNQLDGALSIVSQQLANILTNMSSARAYEHNFPAYVWTESQGDVPAGAAWAPSFSKSITENGGLSMKAKAYTPSIQNVCKGFDAKLNSLVEDCSCYTISPKETIPGPFNRLVDNNSIVDSLKNTCSDGINRFIENLNKDIKVFKSQLQERQDLKKNRIIIDRLLFCGRLCQAFCDLCPNLQRCISKSKANETRVAGKGNISFSRGKTPEDPNWLAIKQKLMDQCLSTFRVWSEYTSDVLTTRFKDALLDRSVQTVMITSSKWEEINIQEETEEGKTISSTIRVPMQTSSFIHTLLYDACAEINRTGGHAVRRIILIELVQKLMGSILDGFENVIEEKWNNPKDENILHLTQNGSLQLLYDLKLLMMIFPRGDDEVSKAFKKRSRGIIDKLENKVDPFDLDVFLPYMQSNLMKQYQRCTVLYGMITTLDKSSSLSTRQPVSSAQEQHSILQLGSSQTRFTLLPLSSGTKEHTQSNLPQPTPVIPERLSISETSESDLKRNQSFYDRIGSMSTSWFSNIGGK